MDLNVYNISYIVGLFGEPNQVHYLPNMERGIDTSGILTMEYNSFKQSAWPPRTAVRLPVCHPGHKGLYSAEIHGQLVRRRDLPPQSGQGRTLQPERRQTPQAAEFHAFARAIEGGDQELCSRMLDTSVAVSRVLTVARRSAGIKFPCDR